MDDALSSDETAALQGLTKGALPLSTIHLAQVTLRGLFIDTNYNSESFFVRHAYFTGEGEPYKKLKRALRAEVDEAAWSQLYSTTSRPFAPPETGKIAVKVTNHYGDEVLKVYEI